MPKWHDKWQRPKPAACPSSYTQLWVTAFILVSPQHQPNKGYRGSKKRRATYFATTFLGMACLFRVSRKTNHLWGPLKNGGDFGSLTSLIWAWLNFGGRRFRIYIQICKCLVRPILTQKWKPCGQADPCFRATAPDGTLCKRETSD